MFNSQYYTCEKVDQRLLQGYVDDFNEVNSTNYSKDDLLLKLFQAINWDQVFGKYEENPEFISVKLDSNGKILEATRKDGTKILGCDLELRGILHNKELDARIANKVDKEEGKSLIDSDFASSQIPITDPEYHQITTDAEDKILEGIMADGTKVIRTPLEIQGVRHGTIDIPDFIQAITDSKGRIIESITVDGKKNIMVETFINAPTHTNKLYTGEIEADEISLSEQGVEKLKEDLNLNNNDIGKSMKIVIYNLDGTRQGDLSMYYIRTKYNENNDIILYYLANHNGLITPYKVYVGSNSLSDGDLINEAHLASQPYDSTAPILSDYLYAIYAQHGFILPQINNTNGLTSADVGAVWEDQSNRQYTIGRVTTEKIYLIPVMYENSEGHIVRDWTGWGGAGQEITSLTHVNGGVHTTAIPSVSGYESQQHYSTMTHSNRTWIVDGVKLEKAGTYYGDELIVSESAIGYDASTMVYDANGNIDIQSALPAVEFTFSYRHVGAQLSANTTINVLREVPCSYYGATQEQFFWDTDGYQAMFVIPKAKINEGVEVDKPFHSTQDSAGHGFSRTSDSLKDINDPVDRVIGFLWNPNTGDYLIGKAAGLSIVSGDTVKEKRNQNIPIGETLLSFSPPNRNKFYVNAIIPPSDNIGFLPSGFFKEINYYVCYFDPAENDGQVYWYKDGDGKYLVYAHCQEQKTAAIKLPCFMEGCSISVVEKTDDTILLTETVQNGKVFVRYNSSDSNYIVLTLIK